MPANQTKPAANAYHAHRERQRQRILRAAEKLFDERGIDRTTMAELISASELRASTMYQYFSNKDEIVWAILGEVMEESAARAKKSVEGPTTGLDQISALLQYMADELTNNQARIRFMAQFDAMYARDWPVERLLTLEGQFHDRGFKAFRTLVRQGIADGSLRPDLDPNLTLHAVINAVIGAQRRLASLGRKSSWSTATRSTGSSAKPFASSSSAYAPTRNPYRSICATQSSQTYNPKEVLVKSHLRIMLAICTTLLPLTSISLVSLPMQAADSPAPRLELPADSGWKFTLGDPTGADAPSFADTSWRTVDLPHDWSIECPPAKDNPSGAGGGFFPDGIGWYRKTFTAPADWKRNKSASSSTESTAMPPSISTATSSELTPTDTPASPSISRPI